VEACKPLHSRPDLVQHLSVGVSRLITRNIRLIETLYLSKFFTFIVTLNVIGIFLAIFNVWRYPRNYTSAFVLGNLLVAILMRNELFGRFLYLVVNTLFAKVSLVLLFLSCWPN
jgi:hypothetical protein